MRRGSTENQNCPACYGARTRVEVHRSRYELERVLQHHGAYDVIFVEADANASIQFAMRGHYVQLALPLPDPEHERFTHTPSGRRRTASAQERAYEQALRTLEPGNERHEAFLAQVDVGDVAAACAIRLRALRDRSGEGRR